MYPAGDGKDTCLKCKSLFMKLCNAANNVMITCSLVLKGTFSEVLRKAETLNEQ